MILESVFAPLPHLPQLTTTTTTYYTTTTTWAWVCCRKAGVDLQFPLRHLGWVSKKWKPNQVIGQHISTIWNPPQEIVAQLIIYDLLTCLLYYCRPFGEYLLSCGTSLSPSRAFGSYESTRLKGWCLPRRGRPLGSYISSHVSDSYCAFTSCCPSCLLSSQSQAGHPPSTNAHWWHQQQATHMHIPLVTYQSCSSWDSCVVDLLSKLSSWHGLSLGPAIVPNITQFATALVHSSRPGS